MDKSVVVMEILFAVQEFVDPLVSEAVSGQSAPWAIAWQLVFSLLVERDLRIW